MSKPVDRLERFRVTALPMGLSESALASYLRQHDLEWIIALRSLVAGLDRQALGAVSRPAGRPPYDPLCLLGLLIYGLLRGVRTLRELERLAITDVGAWYMAKGAQPDHSTLGNFLLRQTVLDGASFPLTVKHCLTELRAAHGGAFPPGTSALDGSVVEAASSRHRTLQLRRAVQKRDQVERDQLDEFDPNAEKLWEKLQVAVETLKAREEERRKERRKIKNAVQVALNEPEAVVQHDKTGKGCASYHVTLLVEQHRLIVGLDAHPTSELNAVDQPLTTFREIYGHPIPLLLMDKGFCNFESLNAAKAASEDVLCPPKTPERKPFKLPMQGKHYDKTAFLYDPETREVVCPQGKQMKQRQTAVDEGQRFTVYEGVGCEQCPVRRQCTKATRRKVNIYEVDADKQQLRKRLQLPEEQEKYALRGQLVELTLADLKGKWSLVRFLRRGLEKVKRELRLWCISYNLWRTLMSMPATA